MCFRSMHFNFLSPNTATLGSVCPLAHAVHRPGYKSSRLSSNIGTVPFDYLRPGRVVVVVVVDRFYVALFSALEQTHCARM